MTAIHVPAAMAARRQWVVWKRELINGRWAKPPYRADGLSRASVTDPSTWATLEDAQVALMNGGGFAGLGYVFTEDDGTTGGDIDYPVDSAEACTVIKQFKGTYCEKSPGGGLHALSLGEVPPGAGNRRNGYERPPAPATGGTVTSFTAAADTSLSRGSTSPAPLSS